MRLQESPPIQPRRNHTDRAWSMLPVLQALMYWLRRGGDVSSGAQGWEVTLLRGPRRTLPPQTPEQYGSAVGQRRTGNGLGGGFPGGPFLVFTLGESLLAWVTTAETLSFLQFSSTVPWGPRGHSRSTGVGRLVLGPENPCYPDSSCSASGFAEPRALHVLGKHSVSLAPLYF